MIQADHLTFSYPGRPPVLRDISFEIATGEHVALMGPNGSGKSTLALLMKGLYPPDSGTLSVDGTVSAGEDARNLIMQRVGLVFQNPDNTIVSTTVERELAFGLENLGIPPTDMAGRIDRAIGVFGLAPYRHTNPASLSGGGKAAPRPRQVSWSCGPRTSFSTNRHPSSTPPAGAGSSPRSGGNRGTAPPSFTSPPSSRKRGWRIASSSSVKTASTAAGRRGMCCHVPACSAPAASLNVPVRTVPA